MSPARFCHRERGRAGAASRLVRHGLRPPAGAAVRLAWGAAEVGLLVLTVTGALLVARALLGKRRC
ncbi:MAG: hypothetical protein IT452_09805 [Planctomycetia bacterium]|nr:hypothetical protein [Planctomycetia bacterium]